MHVHNQHLISQPPFICCLAYSNPQMIGCQRCGSYIVVVLPKLICRFHFTGSCEASVDHLKFLHRQAFPPAFSNKTVTRRKKMPPALQLLTETHRQSQLSQKKSIINRIMPLDGLLFSILQNAESEKKINSAQPTIKSQG